MHRVLLVEDNELNSDMLSRRLRRRGFEVHLAADGPAALNVAADLMPDVILLDMGLPEMDGWEVVRRMKRDEATRTIPVIALTAHAMTGDRERCLEAGCDEFQAKPVDLGGLMQKIAEVVGSRGDGA